MADIRIHIHTADGRTESIEAPANLKLGDFLDDLVDALKLDHARWMIFDKSTNSSLDRNRTLEANGVKPGDHLYLSEEEAPEEAETETETEVKPISEEVKTPAGLQETTRCPKCGHENPSTGRFCEGCGAPLTRPSADLKEEVVTQGETEEIARCPKCGRENPAKHKFCESCGVSLTLSVADIKLHIHTEDGRTKSIEVSVDLDVGEFFIELVKAGLIAKSDPQGHPVQWIITDKNTGVELRPGKSLKNSGVHSGDHLFVSAPPARALERKANTHRTAKVAIGIVVALAVTGVAVYLLWPKPSISISPPRASFANSTRLRFRAAVTGSANRQVSWSTTCPDSSIAPDGTYVFTAPASLLNTTCTVDATGANASPGRAIIRLSHKPPAPLPISIAPLRSIMAQSGALQFQVVPGSNASVKWSTDCPFSNVSDSGVYTYSAPASALNVSCRVNATAADGRSAEAAIHLVHVLPPRPRPQPRPPTAVRVSPGEISLSVSKGRQFTASVIGSSNQQVCWSVNPSLGNISPTGYYTAPDSIKSLQEVSVQALSVADGKRAGHAMVTLKPPPVSQPSSPVIATSSPNRKIIEPVKEPKLEATGTKTNANPASADTGADSSAGPATSSASTPNGTAVTPAAPAYAGPTSGTILWSGTLEKNGTVEIDGKTASVGSLQGSLPGVPVMIAIAAKEFAVAVAPSPANNWTRLVIRSKKRRHAVIQIQWTVVQ